MRVSGQKLFLRPGKPRHTVLHTCPVHIDLIHVFSNSVVHDDFINARHSDIVTLQ